MNHAIYQWLVFTHVAGVFAFLMAHGVNAFVLFRVRAERDITALRALLRLSSQAAMASFFALLVIVAAGVAATFAGNWWGMKWPWVAIGVLLAVWAVMSSTTGPSMRRVRAALGFTGPTQITAEAKEEDLALALATVRPRLSTVVGLVGLLVLLWLMLFKPF